MAEGAGNKMRSKMKKKIERENGIRKNTGTIGEARRKLGTAG
jgi:hypothetical protein